MVRYHQKNMRAPVVVLARPVPLDKIPGLWTIYNRIDATASYEKALPEIARALGLTLPPPPPIPKPVLPPEPPEPIAPEPVAPTPIPQPHPKPPVQPASTMPVLSRRTLFIGASVLAVGAAGVGGWAWFAQAQANTGSGSPQATNTGSLQANTSGRRWNYHVSGEVQSSPAVANGLVYVGSNNGFIYALDATTGSKRRSYQVSNYDGFSPVVANGLIYVISLDGFIYALDA